jgi:hypothetical protein
LILCPLLYGPVLSDATLTAPLACRVFRGRYALVIHELSRGGETGVVPQCGPSGHRHGKRYPTQGLEGVDHWGKPPGLDLVVESLFQTCQPCGMGSDRTDVFLVHSLPGWVRTDHLVATAQGGGALGGAARTRLACRSRNALRRNLAAWRWSMTSSRARHRSRMTSSAPLGTWIRGRSPARSRRASLSASRRLVVA